MDEYLISMIPTTNLPLPEAHTDAERQLAQEWGIVPAPVTLKKILSWTLADIRNPGRWHFDKGNCPNEVEVGLVFLERLHGSCPIFSVEERLAIYKHLFSFCPYRESVELYEGWSSDRRFNHDKILDVFAFRWQAAGDRNSSEACRVRALILCALLSREKGIWHVRQWQKIWDELCLLSLRTPTLMAASAAALIAQASSFKGTNFTPLLRKNLILASKSHLAILRKHDHTVLASRYWETLFVHWCATVFGGGENLRGMFRSWANISYDQYVSLPVQDFLMIGKTMDSLRVFHEERGLRRERNLRKLASISGGNSSVTKV